MRVFDKILDTIKVRDDNAGFEDDGDFFDEEYTEEDFEDEQPRRRIPESRADDEFEEDLPEPELREEREPQPVKASAPKTTRSSSRNSSSKVSPIRAKRQGAMEVCVIRPHSMEDAHEITETLQEGCTVILNLEGLELALAQRLIDYSCGSCYAFRGALQQISRSIFIITPPGVDISGDLQEALNSASFDVPAFGTRF
jgi:cell division inhibitor SepF